MKRFKTSLICGVSGLLLASAACSCTQNADAATEDIKFMQVKGADLIAPDGNKFFIVGTNLGNWLNPEGYMFGFQRMNAPRQINDLFSHLVGPEKTAEFWKQFKDNYITKEDIDFIAATGANTIRLPFHYKLFTDEDYMGLTSGQDGFARIDSVVNWCRGDSLYLLSRIHI